MKREIRWSDEATRLLYEVLRELGDIRDSLSGEFLQLVEKRMNRLSEWPFVAQPVFKDFRRVHLRRFRHYIYYRVWPTELEVVFLVHTSRHPRVAKRFLRKL